MKTTLEKIEAELEALDREQIELDGTLLKPSQCYHVGTDPVHVLFNTNCPDTLRQKVNAILAKHLANESGAQQ